jgi:NADPH:quinone reductase-like Zn-dependent oxidoreductase
LVRVLRLHQPGDLRLHEEPSPTPDAGEVLLQVTAASLSERRGLKVLVEPSSREAAS